MNYTQTPNDYYDKHFPLMKYAELKITLVLIRHTIGYHRSFFECSMSEMAEKAGVSRTAVKSALPAIKDRGLFTRSRENGTTIWERIAEDRGVSNLPKGGKLLTQRGQVTCPEGVSNLPSIGQVTYPITSSLKKERKNKESLKKDLSLNIENDATEQIAPLIDFWDNLVKRKWIKANLTDRYYTPIFELMVRIDWNQKKAKALMAEKRLQITTPRFTPIYPDQVITPIIADLDKAEATRESVGAPVYKTAVKRANGSF